MKIHLENTGFQKYLGTNERGQQIKLSGDKSAVSPMESVLMAIAGCSCVDIEGILQKTRQNLVKVEVDVEGKRAVDQIPAVFTDIHVHYTLHGEIKESKAKKAIELAADKYCSVAEMLHKTVNITHSFEIISEQVSGGNTVDNY